MSFTESGTRLDNDVINGHSIPAWTPTSANLNSHFMNPTWQHREQRVPHLQFISGARCQ